MTQEIYITGSGHTKFGRLDLNLEQMIVAVAQEAMTEAQVAPQDIDAVFLGHFNAGMVGDGFASSLALQVSPEMRFVPAVRCENACASGSAAILAGTNAILAGKARTVLVVGAEKMTHRSTSDVTAALASAGYQNDPRESGLSFPQVFAQVAAAYEARHGDPLPAMARIAEKNHRNALANPLAQMRREMTFDQCNTVTDKNPQIAPPLRLSDCSLISDGAAAVVLRAADAAGDSPRRVKVAALEHVSDFLPISARDVLAFEGPRLVIAKALDRAGIGIHDVDLAEVHDCFTIAELLVYEALGLAKPGRGADALAEGTVLATGSLPVNLSGGLKAKGHPVGATGVSMHALGFRQLTGQAGDMQRHGAEFALLFNMGGAAVANYATILQARKD